MEKINLPTQNKTHIFFCPSTTALYQALEVISALDENARIKIIISDPDFYNFLEKNNIKNIGELIRIPGLDQSIAGSTFKKHAYARIKNNRLYKEFFSNIRNQNIYFFNHHYWDFGLRIIQKLSKKNQIYFYNIISWYQKAPKDEYAIFKLNWIFGVRPINIIKFGNYRCSVITDNFLLKNKIHKITPNYDINKFQKLRQRLFGNDLTHHKILILLDGGFDKHYVDKKRYINAYLHVVNYFLKIFSAKEILIKPHPNERVDIPQLSSFLNDNLTRLPAELLIHPHLKAIVGTSSTALRFSNIHYNNIPRISLINMCYTDSAEKEILSDALMHVPCKILMPKTFEEFKRLMPNHLIARNK